MEEMATLVNSDLDDSFTRTSVADPQDDQAIVRLMRFLETRIRQRELLLEDVHEKQNHFRNILVELEHENVSLRYDNNEQKKTISTLESRVCKLQNHIDCLVYKLNDACDAMRNVQQELRNKDKQLKQNTLEKQKIIQKCNIKVQAENDRMTREMETKLKDQRDRLTIHIKNKDDKMRLVREILTSVREDRSDNVAPTSPIASSSRIETEEANSAISKEKSFTMTPINHQASGSSRGQIRQASFCHARTVPRDIRGKAAEGPSSLAEDKLSKVAFVDSQTSGPRGQIRQVLSCHARTVPNDIRGKAAEGPSSLSEEKLSGPRGQTIRQTFLRAKTNSDGIQKKPIKERTAESSSLPSDLKTELSESTPTTSVDSSSNVSTDTTIVTKIKLNTKIPVVNPRYQRVQNADRWIDHRPTGTVPTGTILQPQTHPNKRTIRKLTNPKDFVARPSRYCLLSQEQDTDGELETKLYKADVLPTCGGGAQIVFNDIECLKQISPTAARNVTGR